MQLVERVLPADGLEALELPGAADVDLLDEEEDDEGGHDDGREEGDDDDDQDDGAQEGEEGVEPGAQVGRKRVVAHVHVFGKPENWEC